MQQLMIGDPLCKRCYHSQSEHVPGLFGIQCKGKFWVPMDDTGADAPCQCEGFVE